jgi:hypothetical protein
MPQADSPLEVMGRAASLQGMLQGNKMQQMQLDEATAAKKDQELLQQVWMEKGGDDDATLAEAPKRGVRMQTVRALQAQRAKAKKELFDMEDSERKAKQEKAKVISSALFPLTQIPEGPEGDAALVQQTGRILQELVQSGLIPPKNAQEQAQFLQQPPAQIRQRVNTLAMMGVQADKQFEAINAEKKAIADAERKREERTAEEKNFQYEYQNYLAAEGLKPNAKLENDYRKVFKQNKTSQLLTPEEEAQKKRIAAAGGNKYSSGVQDIKDTAQAIMEGTAVPVLTNYSFRDRTAIMGELKRGGYNQALAEQDWRATQKHLSTLNGQQQERLRQAITFTSDSTAVIENLYNEWLKVGPASGVKILNRAALATAKNLPGKAGEVATALDAQINDLVSELGTVYKGGNSSTDESLRLAAGNLKADWNEQTFKRALGLIRTNLKIRKNSIMTSEAVGVREGSPYTPAKETGAGIGGGQVQVTDPRGVVHTFPNQAAADAFKKAAGIQ